MNFNTIESAYEYRIKNIIKKYLEDNDVNPEELNPETFGQMLWDGTSELGQLLYEDMLVWMSEENWIEKVKEN